MANRPASWFLTVAIVATVAAVAGVPFMEWLQEGDLNLWLHIPLTLVALTLIGGGAALAGVAFLEYRARGQAGAITADKRR
jgi:ribose/xylose/arabinose/galactoside ABC-type transport system permease subunit